MDTAETLDPTDLTAPRLSDPNIGGPKNYLDCFGVPYYKIIAKYTPKLYSKFIKAPKTLSPYRALYGTL